MMLRGEREGEREGARGKQLEGRGSVGDVMGDEAQHLQGGRRCLHKYGVIYLRNLMRSLVSAV